MRDVDMVYAHLHRDCIADCAGLCLCIQKAVMAATAPALYPLPSAAGASRSFTSLHASMAQRLQ